MTERLDPHSLTSIAAFGEAAVMQSAVLVSDILAAAQDASASRSGNQLDATLSKLRRSAFSHHRDDLSRRTRSLAGQSRMRLAVLAGLEARLTGLENSIRYAITELKQAAAQDPSLLDDALDASVRGAMLERRLVHVTGIENSLARCRILLRQLLSVEHLSDDQLALLRDVTVPVSIRGADMQALSQESAAAQALGNEMDALCRTMIVQDTAHMTAGRKP